MGVFGVTADAGAVEPRRALVFDDPARRRVRALGGVGVDQELPVDEPDPGDPQAVQSARDPWACSRSGTPPDAGGALSQLSSVTHTGLTPAGSAVPSRSACFNSPVIFAASEIETSSEDSAGRSGSPTDSG